MEKLKTAYFYELKTHLGMPDYIEIILWPSSIKISNKKTGESKFVPANIKRF